MCPKRPSHVLLDQVRITREGGDAILDRADALSGARITIGFGLAKMSDAEIVDLHNEILASQWALLQQWDKAVVEEPAGEKQIASPLSSLFQPGDKYIERPDLRLLAALIGCETPTKRRHPLEDKAGGGIVAEEFGDLFHLGRPAISFWIHVRY